MGGTGVVDGRMGGVLRPRTAAIEITRRCNLTCKTCFANSTSDRGLPQLGTGQVVDLVDELVDLGVSSFHIGGGEPTLHPGFLDIARHIRARGVIAGFSTNGTLLTQELVDRMAAFGVRDNILVSASPTGCGTIFEPARTTRTSGSPWSMITTTWMA